MKLVTVKKKNDTFYYMSKSIRNGGKTTTKVIENLGKHSELIKSHPDDLIEYLKKYVEKKTLEEKENSNSNNALISKKIDFTLKVTSTNNIISNRTNYNIGYAYISNIYRQLCLDDFFEEKLKGTKIKYNANDINNFLSYCRVLDPKSKYASVSSLGRYFDHKDIVYYDVERFLPFLASHQTDYLSHLFKKSEKIVKRDTTVCFYDCTNFYFETEQEDPEYPDEETGELLPGFRRYGPSKEHRPNPLVQMGLFMDKNGIPISMSLNHGSCNEQLTAIPLEKEMMKMFNNKKFIYCADAGLGSTNIRVFNDMGGKAFIVTQSIKKLSAELQKEVFEDKNYKLLSDDSSVTIEKMSSFKIDDKNNEKYYQSLAYKVIETDKMVDLGLYELVECKNGKTRRVKSKAKLRQRVIVTFSRKMLEYQRNIRNKQIERAKAIIKNKSYEDIKKGPNDVTRFIKRITKDKNGEVVNNDIYELDKDIISNEEKYDGFYAVATNLFDDSVKEILEINSNRYKIEDCFRVIKTNFNGRPVYHHTKEAITGHFLICYTALLIYRLLENKLAEKNHKFTINQILETLNNMSVTNQADVYYEANYEGGKVLDALEDTFDLGLSNKYYLPKTLHKKFKKIL